MQYFVYSFNHKWTRGLLPHFSHCECCCYDHGLYPRISLGDPAFNSFGYIPRSGIAGSYGSSVSNFLHFLKIYFWESERERETEHKWGRGRERGRHRIWSRLQPLSCQHTARHGARTHELWHHDLSWSQMLNRLSHLGAPVFNFLMASYAVSHSICTVWYCHQQCTRVSICPYFGKCLLFGFFSLFSNNHHPSWGDIVSHCSLICISQKIKWLVILSTFSHACTMFLVFF